MIPENLKIVFRERDGYTLFFVPYSVSETGVKVEYNGPQPEIVKKGELWVFTVEHEQRPDFQADMREAIAMRQRVSFPKECWKCV